MLQADAEQKLLLKAVRSLRIEAISFADDGAKNAYKLIKRLQAAHDAHDALESTDEKLLQQAADWDNEQVPDFLDKLAGIQDNLLDRLQPDLVAQDGLRVDTDVAALLADMVDSLYEKARRSQGSEAAVLEEYRKDLEQDTPAVRDAIRHYTAVLAATCQQAAGYQMNQAKHDNAVFKSVIVDEAARANPLDLFIPLARAERHIVLVGDHRQLPHLLEPDIERELGSSMNEQTCAALKKSLFERLFKQLQQREKKDGIRRVITLDTQYRMHPTLGQFVSDNFYKPHGESFDSGRPAADFTHDLTAYENKVAAWVNISFKKGKENSGKSKSRPVEAQWIAKQLKPLMQQHPGLSFGIISFYAAQITEIFRALVPQGLVTEQENGGYQIAENWQHIPSDDGKTKERLRVGTVDAFQGKEFDVVFLSMTHSNSFKDRDSDPIVQTKLWQRKYGHLMLENRLCVAMSRQQRLLICVGDVEMVKNASAKQAIPALKNFYTLCQGEQGHVIST
ncbi:Uncharacterised protein [Candidatus Venteria ishoeyi]|uniref:DNA helicase n=1 Tax=Candidatus Venteria ishoeyi TaxID=1899563 RepID=A0A1H6F8N7_9GAMM|nr:Uncharacterised protein [Candidatus Venteria ishoeyi]